MRARRYYQADLALVHHLGFGHHADSVAPGILGLLSPILERRGLVVELGCGSGLFTKHLLDAGHRVLATDASRAMIELARRYVPAADLHVLALPQDAIPAADAVVAVGHPLNYLPDAASIERALVAAAAALKPGGVLALDLCDLDWNTSRRDAPPFGKVDRDYAIVTRFSIPAADRFVRDITTFVKSGKTWRRSDERHENVLVRTAELPSLLAAHGLDVEVRAAFGSEKLPPGLRAVVGVRRA